NKRMNLKREQEQISEPVITKRLRESRKAKQMENLHSERVDAYVKKVIESAPPISLEKREPVERVSNGDSRSDVSNGLIPLTENDGAQAVMCRDLHAFLEVSSNYTEWFKRMAEYGFVAGQDFDSKNGIGYDRLGRTRAIHNHVISLDMA